MKFEAWTPPEKSQCDSPAHGLEDNEARSVAEISTLLFHELLGRFNTVEDYDGSSQHGEVKNVGLVFLAPSCVGALGMKDGDGTQVSQEELARRSRWKRKPLGLSPKGGNDQADDKKSHCLEEG
jgi:hypothetical protein